MLVNSLKSLSYKFEDLITINKPLMAFFTLAGLMCKKRCLYDINYPNWSLRFWQCVTISHNFIMSEGIKITESQTDKKANRQNYSEPNVSHNVTIMWW